MIADETVERVRAAADIVAIIGEFVPLKRSGSDFRGACPFHGGTNANFAVSQKKASYHCFVCHESGDVFTFVRKRLGLDFTGAVKLIGERVGIEVIDAPRRAQVADPNERNWEVLATAAEWFRTQLADSVGSAAREYLMSRALDADACARFGIGYAPRDRSALRQYLHTLGFDDARQLEAGLLAQREDESEPRVRFRNRVMFPILDELGHHVGFGGRALGDDTPKYLNSPESPVFHKGRTLYGLHSARQGMRRAERAIVVEGYLDVIRLALAGVDEAVAPLGTALTEEQAALLMRYTNDVFLLYDSDESGQKATFRSGLELLRNKAAVRVVTLPDGEDPDTFVAKFGRAALEGHLSQAIDLFDRQLQLLERAGWFADISHRRRAVDKLLPTIRAARDPLTRDLYIGRLADVAQLDKSTIAGEVDRIPEQPRRMRAADTGADAPGDIEPPRATHAESVSDDHAPPSPYAAIAKRDAWKGKRGRNAGPEWQATAIPPRPRQDEPVERALVRAMIVDRDLAERIAERHPPSDFRDADYRALFDALLNASPDDDLDRIADRLAPGPLDRLRELTDGLDAADFAVTDVSMSIARLEVRPLEARKAEIMDEMRRAPVDVQNVLMRELLELDAEMRRLVPIRSPRGKPRA